MSFKMVLSYIVVFILGWCISILSNFEDRSLVIPESTSDLTSATMAQAEIISDPSYIKSLQRLLSEYQNKLAGLEEDNKLLLKDLIDNEGKLSLLSAKPSIEKKINKMSDEEILGNVTKVFKERYLSNVDNPKAFANRLADIALSEDEVSNDGIVNTDVRISISRSVGYYEMGNDYIVASKYHRLYVNMISSNPLPYALIKWKSLTEDKVLLFSGLSFHSNKDSQFVWAIPKADGWKPGVYQVNVYLINNELTLLASKNYTITEVIDEGPEPIPDVPVVDGPPLKMDRR